jgi:hypothetical protein
MHARTHKKIAPIAPEAPRSPAVVVYHDLRLSYRPKFLKMGLEVVCANTKETRTFDTV